MWEWLKTKHGQGKVTEELKKRKVAKSFRVGIIDAKIVELKVYQWIKDIPVDKNASKRQG